MQTLHLFLFLICTFFYFINAAPTQTKLQTGQTPTNGMQCSREDDKNEPNECPACDADGRPYIEEVTVESILQVRSPGTTSRQTRTNTHTSLQDGTKVEARQYY